MVASNASSRSLSRAQDKDLVARALSGDQGAYTALVKKYSRSLHRYLSLRVKQSVDVDDLVQESFIKAFKSLSTYSTKYAFSTWLYKIATNHAIDSFRRKRLPTVPINDPIGSDNGSMVSLIPDLGQEPDRALIAKQRRLIIKEAIQKLPPKYRRVIILRHEKELSYDEIAKKLNLPLGTVKAHIFRARRQLYRLLRDKRDIL